MINSIVEYERFLNENWSDDLFLHVIPTDDVVHSAESSPSVIIISNYRTGFLYHIGVNHQDVEKIKSLNEVVFDLNKFVGRIFVLDKKTTLQFLPLTNNIYDINLGLYLNGLDITDPVQFETTAHSVIKQNFKQYPDCYKCIPLTKHREMVLNASLFVKKHIKDSIFKEGSYLKINNEIVPVLSELEKIGVFVDKQKFEIHFNTKLKSELTHTQYNLYTSTGRPSNRFGGINYAALKKENGSRSCFVSRFGKDGFMVLIDYSAFHPHIICRLIDFKIENSVDFYSYIAKHTLKKENITTDDIKHAKSLTFRQLYGGVEKQYSEISFFKNLNGFINSHWDEYTKLGYTLTPVYKRKIQNILNPNPNKLFNYILQATETEIAVPILGKVIKYLNNYDSKPVLYTYDSVLFDIHKNEWDLIKEDLISVMMGEDKFPVKCYIGESYDSMVQTN
jgi:DNA polymerase I-like protein with 3'-5' exonuclease and polymerase domains